MSFKSHIASQLDSVKYINDIAKKYQNNIRIGGHSKGGNLAVYAAVFAEEEVKTRIINVYNNDGPGFADDITNTKEYKEMIEKVHTYIPQSSVIGRLLNHEEKYTVVKSIQKGIMQHDLYSWQVQGTKVVSLKEVTNGSEFVDKTIKQWLDDVEPKQREIVIDTIFDILSTTEAESMIQIREKWFKNVGIILKNYKNLDEDSKKMIGEIVRKLVIVAKDNFVDEMPSFGKKK